MKNGIELWEEQYKGLTEDLTPFQECAEFSKDWVLHRVLQNERAHLKLQEDTNKLAGIVTFATVAMPLVRKIFSRLIAMDLVSVQPISQPTAKVFYMDFIYGNNKGGNKGASMYGVRDKDYATRVLETGAVMDMQLKMTSSDITTIEKALKAVWSLELEQDLMAYHKLSVETELISMLQQQIVLETDGLILDDMLQHATAGNVNWNTAGYLGDDKSTWEREQYKKTLFNALLDAGNMIFKKRYRYPTWIVGHPDAIIRFEKMNEFKYEDAALSEEGMVSRHLIGTLFGRYKVYKDPFWGDPTKLLLGYKGASWADASAYYCPYIPLYTTPLIIDPNDFTPRRGLMSRFGYGTLIGDGLATVTLTAS